MRCLQEIAKSRCNDIVSDVIGSRNFESPFHGAAENSNQLTVVAIRLPPKNGWLLGSDPEPFLLPAAPWSWFRAWSCGMFWTLNYLHAVLCATSRRLMFSGMKAASPIYWGKLIPIKGHSIFGGCSRLSQTPNYFESEHGFPLCTWLLPRESDDRRKQKRARPNILVAGTPGTKKTSTCSLLASATALRHINVGELVKDKSFHDGWDAELECYILLDLFFPSSIVLRLRNQRHFLFCRRFFQKRESQSRMSSSEQKWT
jgi:hypothetical protein